MTLWFVFALMTAAAIFAVLWPLGRRTGLREEGSEAVVYKDQLAEIDRDVAAGLIGVSEAGAARVEISRRLLAAADSQRAPPVASNTTLRRAAAVVALVGVPIVAVAFYVPLGSPQLGDFPLAQRARTADAKQPLDNLVAQVEQHLEKNPTDGRGWNVLAPVLAKLGRYDDAVRAYRNSITYNGDSAARRADLGEAHRRGGRWRRHIGGEGRIRTRHRARRRRGQGELFPWPCSRAGRPCHGGGVDLACDCWQMRRRMRRGARWFWAHWRGSEAVPPCRHFRMMR